MLRLRPIDCAFLCVQCLEFLRCVRLAFCSVRAQGYGSTEKARHQKTQMTFLQCQGACVEANGLESASLLFFPPSDLTITMLLQL